MIGTGSQTVGPFFHVGLCTLFNDKLVDARFAGPLITIRGRVIDGDGAGVADAMVEIWQADPKGEYATSERHDGFAGFGRVPTGADGSFRFTTTRPGRVAGARRKAAGSAYSCRHLHARPSPASQQPHLLSGRRRHSEDLVLSLVEPGRRDTLVAREIAPGHVPVGRTPAGRVRNGVLRLLMAADSPLLDPLFRGAAASEVFSDAARLQGMLDFEAALARAAAKAGVIPARAAEVIAECCRPELFDRHQLGAASASAGNPAIPLVSALTQLVARKDAAAAGCVHWGATSQDAIDTGLVLQLRRGLDRFLPETRRARRRAGIAGAGPCLDADGGADVAAACGPHHLRSESGWLVCGGRSCAQPDRTRRRRGVRAAIRRRRWIPRVARRGGPRRRPRFSRQS